MKTKVLSLVAILMMGAFTVLAGNKTEKIKVYGNCGMCESRIEKAVKAVDGVSKADWDKKTKMLEVTFDDKNTNIHKFTWPLRLLVTIPKCTKQKMKFTTNFLAAANTTAPQKLKQRKATRDININL